MIRTMIALPSSVAFCLFVAYAAAVLVIFAACIREISRSRKDDND